MVHQSGTAENGMIRARCTSRRRCIAYRLRDLPVAEASRSRDRQATAKINGRTTEKTGASRAGRAPIPPRLLNFPDQLFSALKLMPSCVSDSAGEASGTGSGRLVGAPYGAAPDADLVVSALALSCSAAVTRRGPLRGCIAAGRLSGLSGGPYMPARGCFHYTPTRPDTKDPAAALEL